VRLVLVHPEIPHNTGCAARLAVALGLPLDLIEPLGFSLEDRFLKRAGLDHWPHVDLTVHGDWASAEQILAAESSRPLVERMHLFTARGGTSVFEATFREDSILVFGCEGTGLPEDLLAAHPDCRVTIPVRPEVRSLNLANSVALAAYTAMRSAGMELPLADGVHTPLAEPQRGTGPADVAVRFRTS